MADRNTGEEHAADAEADAAIMNVSDEKPERSGNGQRHCRECHVGHAEEETWHEWRFQSCLAVREVGQKAPPHRTFAAMQQPSQGMVPDFAPAVVPVPELSLRLRKA